MANLLELAGYVQQQGALGRADGQHSRLSELSSQAYAATGANRDALVQQAIGVDPDAGMALGDKLQQREDGRKTRLAGAAKYLLSAFERGDQAAIQGAYRTVRPEFEAMAQGKPLPDQVDGSILPMLHQVIAAAGGGEAGNQANVQSRFVDAQGNVMALMRDGSVRDLGIKADPNMQIIEGAGGFYGVNKRTLDANPVQVGQPGVQRAPGEVPFSIDPNLPASVQADIRANPEQWANAQDVQIGGGQQLQAPEKPPEAPKPPAGYRFNADGTGLEPIPGGPADRPQRSSTLSAGEAAKVRTNLKEITDAINAFRAFESAVDGTDNLSSVIFDPQAKGRLGTAYNNARAYLRVLYNTGVLQPGELPMLENALRDPTSLRSVLDPRTRGQINAQLAELYKLSQTNIENLVNSYPQLFDRNVFEQSRERRSMESGAANGVDDLLSKYGAN